MEFKALTNQEITDQLNQPELEGWIFNQEKHCIEKEFSFKGYYKTAAFFSSIAWQAQKSCHHPDVFISFGKCHVSLNTHDVEGISYKDMELAKTLNQIYF